MQLLRRAKRKVELTEAGQVFLERARDALARAETAARGINFERRRKRHRGREHVEADF